MRGATRRAVLIGLVAAFACGGLVLGVAGPTGADDDGMRVVLGWLCAVGGAWLLVALWRAPVGGPGRHASGHDPVRREFGTIALLVLMLVGGAVGIIAAVVQRDLVMLGWSLVVASAGGSIVGMTFEDR